MKRLLAVVLGLAIALIGSVAVAAWLSTGSGSGTASATTVDTANAPEATRVASTVSLTWTPSTLANGAAVTGYKVYRHVGSTSTLLCTVTSASCVDTTPSATAVSYGVVATIGTNWHGPESDLTAFTFDDVAPSTTADVTPTPNAAGWNKAPGNVTVDLQATDTGSSPSAGVDHINYTLDGGSTVVVNGPSASVPVSGAGNHTLTYFAVDGAGNTEDTHTLTVKIDPNAPVTTFEQSVPANGAGWNHEDVTLSFSSTDAGTSGIKSVTVDGVATDGATASKTLTTEGTHTVSYFATDNADNVEGTKTLTVRIDKTSPTASIDPAGGTSWTNDNSVAITASDALSGLASTQYSVDGGPLQVYSGPVTVADGTRSFRYVVTDVAGNVTDQTASIKVDASAPSASLTQVGNGQPTINGSDATSGVASVSWRDGSTGNYTTVNGSSTTLDLSNGSHTIWYYATDNAGNQSTSTSKTITVGSTDAVAPTISNIEPGNEGPAGWNSMACSTGLPGNQGRICVTATDNVGVVGVEITLTKDGARCWSGNGSSGTFDASFCGTPVALSLSGGVWVSGPLTRVSNSGSPNFNNGTYTLAVTARDAAGNTTTATRTFIVNAN